MKKINKPLSFVLAFITCLCLAGCSEEPDDTPVSDPKSSVTEVSTPDTPSEPAPETPSVPDNSEPAVSDTVQITLEPVVEEVLDIEGSHLTGFGFHKRTVYGNAFGIIQSFGSADGNIIDNAPISIVPLGMTDLDDILATEYCYNIKKEDLVETDFGDGTTGWTYNEQAAEKQAKNCGDYSIDALYEEMKMIELTGAGLSQEEARKQIKIKLSNVGLVDER